MHVTAKDLLAIPKGTITAQGLRWNIDVGLQYLASWLDGNGCVPIYNLMEDAATAEISRTQVWQWVKHGAKLDTGETVTAQMARDATAAVLDRHEEQRWAKRNSTPANFPRRAKSWWNS